MSQEPIYPFANGSEQMVSAALDAQQNFKYFWRELSWEYRRIVPGLDLAAVKCPFATDSADPDAASYEHLWMNQIQFDGEQISGVLLNQPEDISELHAGDSVTVSLTDISDWMYAIQGKVYGGYSIQVMRAAMSKQERAGHDAAWGLEFGDPSQVLISPYQSKGKPKSSSFLGKWFGSSKPEVSLEDGDFSRSEHPMSENMAEKIAEALTEHPHAVTDLDADGWTMLHREALAGNLTPVRLLVQHGADKTARNAKGQTALELATLMGWPNIIEFLRPN